MTDLIHRHCVPCEGGVPAVHRTEAEAYLESLPGWELDGESKMIAKKVNGRTFMGVIESINRIAELAESEQHHPDLHLTGYRHLTIQLTTHAIGGLSENDFILAAKIDEIFK
ncbi:4a-hydroxytetrahydrobiopterin dehydratase [Neorhodopirellula pilleata]|uniref:4a-hydroxytetrahydrobiopterin dehydratase n=1 Tax=Neorhodopirellula pilleata TaxID=2714738 RepID=A0A5C6AUY0_9BACT|nr:4a-hydroxytetrahydrobiopterin dehydratase [Neorhodopirellula pilleata]TWU03815.1 putative pterin-4-alpha-carbinolamine dehydratase [Neorhodopirellula pilleata]